MRTIALAIVLIVLGNPTLVHAADLGDDQVPREKAIQQWIADWDKPSFSARNEASRHLREAGDTAFPALVDAARHGSQETIARAMAILKSSLHANDGSLKALARKTLDQVAAGPNASAARSAQQVLRDFDRPPSQLASAQGFGMPNGQMQFGLGGIGPQPNFNARINTWTFNDTTTLEAFEPGKKIKFQSDAVGRIKVEITQKKQGVERTDKFEAANSAELKTKHPEAHQAYQKYEPSLQQARLLAQRTRGMPGAPAMPPVPGIPNIPMPGAGAIQQVLQINDAQIELLRRHIAQAPTPAMADSLNRSLQQLIQSRDQLQRELNRNR